MIEVITYELLEQALSPEPRDFENIEVIKTYENVIGEKVHAGFIVYVRNSEDDCVVLRDEGYCIFTIGNGYHDEYISEKEENIMIDDPRIPQSTRDKWVESTTEQYEAFGLDDLEYLFKDRMEQLCPSLREIVANRMNKLSKIIERT